jgi:predicted nucleotide-binding protein
MVGVPPKLMQRLEAALNLSRRRVQAIIQESARVNRVARDIAALIVAGDNGVSYDRFATPEQMAILRGVPVHTPVTAAPPAAPASAPPRVSKTSAKTRSIRTTKNNSVFVVHGRDAQLNEDMFQFLRALNLNPLEWNQAVRATRGANPNVTAVIKNALKSAQGVVVMFSPDEEARLKKKFRGDRDSSELEGQARLNVVFEAGIALGAHEDKTLLIEVGYVRKISDIAGMHIPRLTDSAASRKEFAERLRDKLGLKVDMSGTSWLSVGKFTR